MNRKWGVRTRVGHSETLGVGVWVNGKGMGKGYGLGVWVKGVRPIPPPPRQKYKEKKVEKVQKASTGFNSIRTIQYRIYNGGITPNLRLIERIHTVAGKRKGFI